MDFVKSMFFLRKNNDFRGSAPPFFMFFQCFFDPFSASIFASIFSWFWDPFWLHFRPLGDPLGFILAYFFGIDFFMIFSCHFGSFLDPDLGNEQQAQASFFSYFFLFFLGLVPGVDFGLISDGFL